MNAIVGGMFVPYLLILAAGYLPRRFGLNVIDWRDIRASYEGDLARCRENLMEIVWTILIGFVAGVIAKFIMPGKNEPRGFILTTLLGIAGAFVATYLGQAIGWYGANEGARFIGAIVGAIILLVVWGMIAGRRGSL
jgi:uncharacterized membrane protein YeaQ/YmgE (transglycosylase-associated protein family)